MIVFDSPVTLYIAPLAGVMMAGLAYWARRTRISRAVMWSPSLGRQAAGHGRWGALLLGLVAVAAFAALAGPRWGTRVVEAETKGLSLVLAVDVSRSMLAEDVAPSRLERAKREARRLIHDLGGDRIGLIAFAGQSFIMSPLTVDGSALHLLVDALDPDIASAGGSNLARALRQGHELVLAGDEVADRVLVVFSDGEAHDSLQGILAAARRLRRDGVRLVLVAEGGLDPVRIPLRDREGRLVGYQRDPEDRIVETRRRDDILTAVADAARGFPVSAEVADQAGRVRQLVAGFKRTPQATTTAAQDVTRAWIPLLVAVGLLGLHSVTRKTAALAVLALSVGVAGSAGGQAPRNGADEAWLGGQFSRARDLYLAQAREGRGGDTVRFNLGTAALASGDSSLARRALGQAAESLDPEIRFRARFNLGLMELLLAELDSDDQARHLEEARRHYREALLLRPEDAASKWNLELAVRRTPPERGGGSEGTQGSGSEDSEPAQPQGLSAAQAEQILNSIAEEERQTRLKLNSRRSQLRETRVRRDW